MVPRERKISKQAAASITRNKEFTIAEKLEIIRTM